LRQFKVQRLAAVQSSMFKENAESVQDVQPPRSVQNVTGQTESRVGPLKALDLASSSASF
jgi:hypothetical protein